LQVATEHLYCDLRGLAAETFSDPVTEEGDHLALDAGITLQNFPQRLLRGGLIHGGVGAEFNM
jgi:hypothetical protein